MMSFLDGLFLQTIGIKRDFQLDVIQWLDKIVDMKNIKQFDKLETRETCMQEFETKQHYFDVDVEDEYLCNKHVKESFAAEILQSIYGKVSVDNVAEIQKHLTVRTSMIETLQRTTKASNLS